VTAKPECGRTDTVTGNRNSARTSRAEGKEALDDKTRLAYSVDEACKALGIGRVLMYDLINTKRIHSVKVGARRLIPASALAEFLVG
jgi:excisionase family DNA binding protein